MELNRRDDFQDRATLPSSRSREIIINQFLTLIKEILHSWCQHRDCAFLQTRLQGKWLYRKVCLLWVWPMIRQLKKIIIFHLALIAVEFNINTYNCVYMYYWVVQKVIAFFPIDAIWRCPRLFVCERDMNVKCLHACCWYSI